MSSTQWSFRGALTVSRPTREIHLTRVVGRVTYVSHSMGIRTERTETQSRTEMLPDPVDVSDRVFDRVYQLLDMFGKQAALARLLDAFAESGSAPTLITVGLEPLHHTDDTAQMTFEKSASVVVERSGSSFIIRHLTQTVHLTRVVGISQQTFHTSGGMGLRAEQTHTQLRLCQFPDPVDVSDYNIFHDVYETLSEFGKQAALATLFDLCAQSGPGRTLITVGLDPLLSRNDTAEMKFVKPAGVVVERSGSSFSPKRYVVEEVLQKLTAAELKKVDVSALREAINYAEATGSAANRLSDARAILQSAERMTAEKAAAERAAAKKVSGRADAITRAVTNQEVQQRCSASASGAPAAASASHPATPPSSRSCALPQQFGSSQSSALPSRNAPGLPPRTHAVVAENIKMYNEWLSEFSPWSLLRLNCPCFSTTEKVRLQLKDSEHFVPENAEDAFIVWNFACFWVSCSDSKQQSLRLWCILPLAPQTLLRTPLRVAVRFAGRSA
eukprot:5675672-Prymnesium_polylepis.2